MVAYALKRVLTGTISSAEEGLLPGVNVVRKGTTNGTATDAKGAYSLRAPNDQSILFISAIGFTIEEISVEGLEAWTEYRRTGLPVLPAKDPRAVFENDGVLPTRLPYPTSEASLNNANLEKGITLIGGKNDTKSKLWWSEK